MLRLSAPALKWQGAPAGKPSLPNCISQKNALPRAIAAVLSLITSFSSAALGPGTATVLRDPSLRPPPPPLSASLFAPVFPPVLGPLPDVVVTALPRLSPPPEPPEPPEFPLPLPLLEL